MIDQPMVRDVVMLLGALILALPAGALTVRRATPELPAWPVRLYLLLFRINAIPWIRSYADRRRTFSRREQFLASSFVWFFIFFVSAAMAFGCNYRLGCQ